LIIVKKLNEFFFIDLKILTILRLEWRRMFDKFSPDEIFPVAQSVGNRPWGTEDLLALVSTKFSVKRLRVKAGNKGGLQFHRLKDEVAVIISGEMLIRYDLGDKILKERIVKAGDVVHFPPGLVHQEEAVTDCEIIEASTPHFNDRVRMEESYGKGVSKGLPTTLEAEIELK
jgi:mannose-6-phosphate isomerase-like protein (cupin superfamily)